MKISSITQTPVRLNQKQNIQRNETSIVSLEQQTGDSFISSAIKFSGSKGRERLRNLLWEYFLPASSKTSKSSKTAHKKITKAEKQAAEEASQAAAARRAEAKRKREEAKANRKAIKAAKEKSEEEQTKDLTMQETIPQKTSAGKKGKKGKKISKKARKTAKLAYISTKKSIPGVAKRKDLSPEALARREELERNLNEFMENMDLLVDDSEAYDIDAAMDLGFVKEFMAFKKPDDEAAFKEWLASPDGNDELLKYIERVIPKDLKKIFFSSNQMS